MAAAVDFHPIVTIGYLKYIANRKWHHFILNDTYRYKTPTEKD